MGLMKLDEQRERGDLIEVYKILKGLTRIDPNVILEGEGRERRSATGQGDGGQWKETATIILLLSCCAKVDPSAH